MEHCEEHGIVICACGFGVGEMQLRQGILVFCDSRGRIVLRAPRRADARMAQRVVATMRGASDDVSKHLVENLTGVGPK